MGVIGGGSGAITYEWVGEQWLASWLSEERVVEAILGDSAGVGQSETADDAAAAAAAAASAAAAAAAAAKHGDGPQGGRSKGDHPEKKGHDTHVEVLKRADGLLCFMADHDRLSEKHLDLLWAAGIGQPDAQVRAVFRLFEHLCPRLDGGGLDVLYGHLRDMPPQYEEMHVQLIHRFAEAASGWGARGGSADRANTSHDANPQSIFGRGGNELLWESVQDHAPVTAEVADQASEALAILLCHPSGADGGNSYSKVSPGGRLQAGMGYLSGGGGGGGGGAAATAAAKEGEIHWKRLMFFFDMCLENVEGGKSVAPSLRLMQRIIDAQPETSTNKAWANAVVGGGAAGGGVGGGGGIGGARGAGGAGRKDEILETLNKDRSLLKLLVDELLRYRAHAQTAATQEVGVTTGLGDSLGSAASGGSGGGAAGAARDPLSLKLLGARLPHGEALEIRLDFIRFVVSKSNLELTFGLVELLWRDFLQKPLCATETEIFFAWMQRTTPVARATSYGVQSDQDFYTMSSTVVHEVFRHLLCEEGGVDFGSLGPKGFWCLWRYLSVVNMEAKALSGSTASKNHIVVQDFFSIQGLDTLWEAFVRSRHPAVVKDAGDFLTQLHLRLRVPSDRVSDVWYSFVKRCMTTFEVALKVFDSPRGGGDGAAYGVVACERVMRLLVKFLDEVDSPTGAARSYVSVQTRDPEEVTLKVVVRGAKAGNAVPQKRELFYDMQRYRVTVGALRGRVSHEMAHPANQVRLVFSHRMLSKDQVALEAEGVTSYCEAVLLDKPADDTRGYRPLPREKSTPWDSKLAKKIPRDILANNDNDGFLHILFRLMEVGPPSLADVTRALVQTLPVNERILKELRTMGGRLGVRVGGADDGKDDVDGHDEEQDEERLRLGGERETVGGDASGVGGVKGGGEGGSSSASGREVVEVDWATLLDGSRVLELLYRLEVVYTLVEPAGDVYALPGDRMDASEWVRVFLQTGGMQHLLGLLGRDRDGDNGIDPSQSLHKACLAALLKLVAHFTTSRKATPTPAVDAANGGAKSAKDVLRELYAGVDLPKLVQRMLVVMHEVSRPTAETGRERTGFGGLDSDARYGHHNAPSALAVAAVEEADGKHRPPPQAEVVQHTMSLLGTLTELQPELSSVMLSSPGLGPALEFSLLHTPEKLVRREVSTGVLRMAISLRKTSKEDSVQVLLRLLLPFLPEVEQYESRCDTYLSLVGWLIGQSNAMPPNEQADLCLHLADLICARPVVEQSEEDQDPVLAGYMTFLKKALKTLPDCRRAEVKATAGADVIPPPPPPAAATAAAPTTPSRRTSATAAAAAAEGEAGVGSPSAAATRAVAAVTTAAGQLVGGMWGAGRATRGGRQEEGEGTAAGGGGGGRGLVRELVERCLFSLPHERGSSTVSSSSGSGVEGGGVGMLRGGGAGDVCAAVGDDDGFEGIPLPKCKSDKSREVAFILLNELATGCASNLDLAVALVGPQHFLGRNSAEGRRRRNDEQQDRFRSSGGIGGTTSSSQSAAEDRDRDMDMDMGAKSRARAASFGQQPHHIAKHKSKTGFVGLKNMGCICYMNSTLQQLFMVPEFREGVLDFRDHDQTPPDDSLMWQLQNMFSHLQESEKAHFNPVGLVRSLRDWEGQALDVMVQQDASEFITQFFQQVEGQVMGSPSENILKQSFGGLYSNELLAEGGLLYSERPEPFSYISVEVKNMKTLAEALEVFTAEEVVSFKWDKEINAETGERQAVTLNTKKRCSIKSLPNHLLIHLKRFDFDFDTMQQTKINDRLEFPIELNMYPYTKEGRAATTAAASKEGGHEEVGTEGADAEVEKEEEPAKPEEYYHYHLAGVVVHMGTANSGHYYSYIRPRDGGGEWLEFNDTVVSTFDVEDMEAECYGGEENSQHSTSYQRSQHAQQGQYSSVVNGSGSSSSSSSAWRRERTRNAFMLVYDRVMPEQQQGEPGAGEGSGSRRRRRRGPSPSASPRSLSPPPPLLSPTAAAAAAAAVSASPGAGGDGDGWKRGGKGRGAVVLGPRRRKRFRARVPAVFMRQIHRENLEFWRKKNVLDKPNYAFLQKLVFQATDEDGVSTASALRLACRFTLGTLVQAQEREVMTTWAGMVRQHLPLRPEACRWLLNELGGSPSTVKELLLSPEESVRYAATSVATAALQRCMQAASDDSGGEPGGGGGPAGDGDDAYTAAYAAAIEARDRREFPGGQGGTAEGFVALGGGEGVPSAEAAGDNDAFLAQKMGLLSMWGGRQEAMAPSHRVGKGQIGSSHRESEKAAAAAAVVVFVDACLGLLSVAPSINHLDWVRSEQLLSILAVTAEAGPSERSHLLQTGALGALMSMFLGDDSPYPELVRSPRPRPRLVPSGDGQVSSPASPRRPYRSPFPPAAEGADGGEGRGLRGVGGGRAGGRNGAKEYYDATKDFGEDRDLSALLMAISPLVLASELAWGESASSDAGTAGGTAAPAVCFSPVALRPLSRMSEEEKQMLTSPAFLMRLIMLLREPKQKDQLIPLLQHLCWRNQLVTKVVIINICQRIEILRDVDAHLSKPGFRALMIILSEVPDGLQQWRLDLAVSRVLEIMEEHTTLTVVTEQAVEMLVRLCRASMGARRWLAEHWDRLDWMESWLNQAMLAKQKHGANAGSRYYGARMNGPPTSVSEDKSYPGVWHEEALASIRAVRQGDEMPACGYDSDDDPQVLLEKRIKVKWRGEMWYPGTITEYNPDTNQHTCVYDDGDIKQYVMPTKAWRFLQER